MNEDIKLHISSLSNFTCWAVTSESKLSPISPLLSYIFLHFWHCHIFISPESTTAADLAGKNVAQKVCVFGDI